MHVFVLHLHNFHNIYKKHNPDVNTIIGKQVLNVQTIFACEIFVFIVTIFTPLSKPFPKSRV